MCAAKAAKTRPETPLSPESMSREPNTASASSTTTITGHLPWTYLVNATISAPLEGLLAQARELVARFPLSGGAPSGPDAASLARRLDRTVAAIVSQWNDAHTYCLGRESSVASDQLKTYLDMNGLCD